MSDGEKNRKYDVLCVGLALGNVMVRPVPEQFKEGDTVQVDEIALMCGGDAFNQASVLSALGHKTALISKVADDVTGKMVLKTMRSRSVDTSMVAIDSELGTSSCIVLVKADGRRNFCTYRRLIRRPAFNCLKQLGQREQLLWQIQSMMHFILAWQVLRIY